MALPFMSVEHLKNFNDSVIKQKVFGSAGNPPAQTSANKTESAKTSQKYDPNQFDSFIVSPDTLDDQIIIGLVDLFDNKISAMNDELKKYIDLSGPNTEDKLREALAVGYITEDGIPVAGCTLRDPTTSDYHGNIPSDHYEMLSGVNLEDRVEQEFFEIHPDYHDMGLAYELRRLIGTVVDKTYIVVPVSDTSTLSGLANGGYKKVSEFVDDSDDGASQLWINE